MDNNKFKKFCSHIDYNTYVNIKNSLLLSGMGIGAAEIFASSHQDALSVIPLCLLALSNLLGYLGFASSDGKNYTKDVTEIRKLYKDFICNYNKLNKIFDLNDPISIYTMFNHLLYKGYLSTGKKFEFSQKQARDIDGLYGTDIITGKGVCRHISSMLTDILNEDEIDTIDLDVYLKSRVLSIKKLKYPKYTKEELMEWAKENITDEEEYKDTIFLIEDLVDNKNKNIELFYEDLYDNPMYKKYGNHQISFAYKNGKNYFLDPTNTKIYRMSESDRNILLDDEVGEVPITTNFKLEPDTEIYIKMRYRLLMYNSNITKEEEQRIIEKTRCICEDNMDIFDRFYNENNELYDEISSKVLKIKRPNPIIR